MSTEPEKTEKAKKTEKTYTWEVTAIELLAAITAVQPHAGTEDTLPGLCAIRFDAVEGHLYAVATDRYTLGTYRMDGKGDHEFDALVATSDIKLLVQLLKAPIATFRHTEVPVILELTGRVLRVAIFGEYLTFRIQPLDANAPAWRSFIGDTHRSATLGDADAVRAFNPKFLRKFEKASTDPHEPMIIMSGATNKPSLVAVGERFVGVIMPVRIDKLPSLESRVPAWMLGKQPKSAVSKLPPADTAPAEKPVEKPAEKPAA